MTRRKCCCNSSSCTVFSDDFKTDDLATAWTVASGSWSIAGNALSCPDDSAKAMADFTWRLDDGTESHDFHPHVITATLTAQYNKVARIWWASGHAEIKWGDCNRWHIFDTSGDLLGVSDKIAVADGAVYTMTICITDSAVTVAGLKIDMETTSIKAGVGTGSSNGSVKCTSFKLQKHGSEKSGCPTCSTGGSSSSSSGCVYFSDDFTCDDLDDAWDQKAGTWTISGGVLSASDSNAVIISKMPYPDDDGAFHPHVIQVAMKAVAGSHSRIIFSYDGGNYNYFEVYWNGTHSTYTIQGSGVASPVTVSGLSFTNGELYAFKLCVSEDSVVVNSDGATAIKSTPFSVTSSTTSCGLGTGAATGSMVFDNFSTSKSMAGCPTCVSNCSSGGDLPPYLSITLSGAVDMNLPAGVDQEPRYATCLNRTYSVPLLGSCLYRQTVPACTVYLTSYEIMAMPGINSLSVTISGATFTIPSLSAVGATDRLAWNNLNVPYVSQNANGYIDFRGATLTVSAASAVANALPTARKAFCDDCSALPDDGVVSYTAIISGFNDGACVGLAGKLNGSAWVLTQLAEYPCNGFYRTTEVYALGIGGTCCGQTQTSLGPWVGETRLMFHGNGMAHFAVAIDYHGAVKYYNFRGSMGCGGGTLLYSPDSEDASTNKCSGKRYLEASSAIVMILKN